MVDKDAVAAIRQIEGDILVGLLAVGSTIFVPDLDNLTLLD